MGRFAHLITRKWVAGLLALFAILGTGAVIGLVGQAESPATGTAALPTGTDSREAAELRDQLPEAEGSAAVVLYSSDQPLTADALAAVQEQARTLPGATGAPAVVSEDGTAATVVVPVTTDDAVETAEVVTDLRTAAAGGPARGRDRAGHRACGDPGRPRRGVRRRELPPARRHGLRRRDPARDHLPQPDPLAGAADRRRRRRPAGRRAGHPHPGRARRALGRVDDRHPLGARLRCRHRLRTAADQSLPRRAAGHRGPPRGHGASRCAAPPRPSCPARPPWCSACSPCCCRSSRPPAASAWPAPSASSWRRPSRSWCCRPPWSSSAAGSSGRRCRTSGEAGLADGHSFWRRVGDAVASAPPAFVTVTVIVLGVMAGGIAQHPDRARPGRPVPPEAGGHRRERAAGAVLPRRRRRPGLRDDPRRR